MEYAYPRDPIGYDYDQGIGSSLLTLLLIWGFREIFFLALIFSLDDFIHSCGFNHEILR